MARKKPTLPGRAAAEASVYDDFFLDVLNEVRKDYPDAIYTGGEEAGLLICLPVPALSVRYLLQQEGWPLGRFVMLVGEQESCKSSLLYEIIRWHRLQRGFGVVIDTEYKPAPELLHSILNYDSKACAYQKCQTLDGWCSSLNSMIQHFKVKMDGDGKQHAGFGRVFPVCFGVDSLTAVLNEDEYKRLVRDGVPESHFAVVARMLTDYVRVVTKEIDGYPFSLVGINHLKPASTQYGAVVRNIAGGKGLRFHQAMEIELKRKSPLNPASSKSIRRNEGDRTVEGVELQISTMKNSNAPHETISVEMLWYIDFQSPVNRTVVDPETGETSEHPEYRQKTFFDWHSASIELLAQIVGERTRQARMLQDVIQLNVSRERRTAWSPTLDVPESEKVSWRELGERLEAKLQQDASFRDALYPLLGIRRRFLFRGGVDYRDVMAAAIRSAINSSRVESNGPGEQETSKQPR